MKRFIFNFAIILAMLCAAISTRAQRQTTLLNADWKFSLGHALSFEKNFMTGTEQFADHYTDAEHDEAIEYFDQQCEKFEGDIPLQRKMLMQIYANPVFNAEGIAIPQ